MYQKLHQWRRYLWLYRVPKKKKGRSVFCFSLETRVQKCGVKILSDWIKNYQDFEARGQLNCAEVFVGHASESEIAGLTSYSVVLEKKRETN